MHTVSELKNIKKYYSEISDFLISEQGKNRYKDLEREYLKELEDFFTFWKKIMDDFEGVKKEEIKKVIRKNKKLSKEMYEILQTTTGFEAPPDKEFLALLAVRKIAMKLKTNDAV